MIRYPENHPTKRPTDKKFERLEIEDFLKMEKKLVSEFSWGSRVNNPCQIYETPDGRQIEAYGVHRFGIVDSAFIEIK